MAIAIIFDLEMRSRILCSIGMATTVSVLPYLDLHSNLPKMLCLMRILNFKLP
jgi:hypothetical protein